MVGGEEEAYEKAAKILQHMGKNVIHTGAIGTGQVISKLSEGATDLVIKFWNRQLSSF